MCVLVMILGVEEASRPGALIDPYDITKKVALLVCIAEYDNTSLNSGQSYTCKINECRNSFVERSNWEGTGMG
jgi:hypothetical protein